MKAESRGKYPGVKLHLDEAECAQLLNWKQGKLAVLTPLLKEMADSVSTLLTKNPEMLKERTQAQILKALKRDQKKISEQLTAMSVGADWKEVE